MRFELNTFTRYGEVLDASNKIVKRVFIGPGLSESSSAEEWKKAVVTALARAGYAPVELPSVELPLSRDGAVERFTVELQAIS